jgi:hypothetical protein
LLGRAAQAQRWIASRRIEDNKLPEEWPFEDEPQVPGLDLFWEDEHGQILEKCPAQFNVWDYIENPNEVGGSCCLRFIDEYGDTTFNQSQIPVLIGELEELIPKSKSEKASQSLQALVGFARHAEGKIHTYLKFIGD